MKSTNEKGTIALMQANEQSAELLHFSPFDDPVVSACFSSVETAGLAVQSFANSVTAPDGITIAEVTEVTPQSYSKIPGQRGTRVDVKSKTAARQKLIFEVNLYTDKTIHQRNFLAAAQIVTASSKEGTTPKQFVETMPFVIAINLLNFEVRQNNSDWVQPAKFVYTKPPHDVALPQFVIYDIELPKFRKAKPDFTSDLYCWLYAMETADRENKTIKEVVEMTTELRDFEMHNLGFQQFCNRYQFVATDPDTRDEYLNWQREMIRQQGVYEGALETGAERRSIETAQRMFEMNLTLDQIATATQLPLDTLRSLRQDGEVHT